jgi:hypothetical protein
MKPSIIIICFFAISTSLFSGQNEERKIVIELKSRSSFYEITSRNELLMDTLFHANSGFKIFPDFDIIPIGTEDYVVFKYPDFSDGVQIVKDYSKTTAGVAVQNPVNVEIVSREIITVNGKIKIVTKSINGKTFAMKKSDFDVIEKSTHYSVGFNKLKNYNLSFGILTIPFKLRPKIDSVNFNITTDVTLGPYFGITKRFSPTKRYYFTIPATLGLSYININDNNTSNINEDNEIGIVPGITWSTGLILQLEDFNIGVVLGQDYASSVGDDWIYNGKLWFSFAIGYNFLNQK